MIRIIGSLMIYVMAIGAIFVGILTFSPGARAQLTQHTAALLDSLLLELDTDADGSFTDEDWFNDLSTTDENTQFFSGHGDAVAITISQDAQDNDVATVAIGTSYDCTGISSTTLITDFVDSDGDHTEYTVEDRFPLTLNNSNVSIKCADNSQIECNANTDITGHDSQLYTVEPILKKRDDNSTYWFIPGIHGLADPLTLLLSDINVGPNPVQGSKKPFSISTDTDLNVNTHNWASITMTAASKFGMWDCSTENLGSGAEFFVRDASDQIKWAVNADPTNDLFVLMGGTSLTVGNEADGPADDIHSTYILECKEENKWYFVKADGTVSDGGGMGATGTDYGIDASVEGYWRMNANGGNETDRSGNGITLTEVGSVPRVATVPSGFSGYSRDFESTAADANVLGCDDADLEINGNQDFTYFVRFKAESDHFSTLIGQWLTTGNQKATRMERSISTGDNSHDGFVSSDGSNHSQALGGTAVDTDWHTCAVVFDYDAGGSTITVYLDGSEDTNGAQNPKSHTGGIFDSSAWFAVGGQLDSSGANPLNCLDGLIYEAGVWSRTMSAAEIQEMHTYGIDGDKGAND